VEDSALVSLGSSPAWSVALLRRISGIIRVIRVIKVFRVISIIRVIRLISVISLIIVIRRYSVGLLVTF
jgi:hypothetical protein